MTEIWNVSPSVDMLPFGMTIPANVPQRSEIPEGLMNHPVLFSVNKNSGTEWANKHTCIWRVAKFMK